MASDQVKLEKNEVNENKEPISNEIEDIDPNTLTKEKLNEYLAQAGEAKNKRNLLFYCGISDPTTEIDGCARVNSIYAPKFGKRHIRKSKIMNPYGALTQMYQNEMIRIQNQKSQECSSALLESKNDFNQ